MKFDFYSTRDPELNSGLSPRVSSKSMTDHAIVEVIHEDHSRDLLKRYQEVVNCKAIAAEAKGTGEQIPRLFSKVANSREIKLIDLECTYADYRKKHQKKEIIHLPLKQAKVQPPRREYQPKMQYVPKKNQEAGKISNEQRASSDTSRNLDKKLPTIQIAEQ